LPFEIHRRGRLTAALHTWTDTGALPELDAETRDDAGFRVDAPEAPTRKWGLFRALKRGPLRHGGCHCGSTVQNDERNEYLARLLELEREVHRVQRQLALERPKAALPQGRFEAVRVLIGTDEYAVPCGCIREIVRYARLTRIPGAPEIVAGALNLRGTVVPVVDVPQRLGLGATRVDLKTPIVIVEVHDFAVGFLFERVADVVTITSEQLTPSSGGLSDSPFVAGVTALSGRLLQLLRLDDIVSDAELVALDAKLSGSAPPSNGGAGTLDERWEEAR
jgi:purine-binding chemotaxis protein CheW